MLVDYKPYMMKEYYETKKLKQIETYMNKESLTRLNSSIPDELFNKFGMMSIYNS